MPANTLSPPSSATLSSTSDISSAWNWNWLSYFPLTDSLTGSPELNEVGVKPPLSDLKTQGREENDRLAAKTHLAPHQIQKKSNTENLHNFDQQPSKETSFPAQQDATAETFNYKSDQSDCLLRVRTNEALSLELLERVRKAEEAVEGFAGALEHTIKASLDKYIAHPPQQDAAHDEHVADNSRKDVHHASTFKDDDDRNMRFSPEVCLLLNELEELVKNGKSSTAGILSRIMASNAAFPCDTGKTLLTGNEKNSLETNHHYSSDLLFSLTDYLQGLLEAFGSGGNENSIFVQQDYYPEKG
ncbi:hypothetical protein HDU84_005878 [Entophlyctis sp. JEL0112]|nr:hypothetical protein HDU84_005878 [Entophlyctis sp. JEL0112]